jgi:hypothetical protein
VRRRVWVAAVFGLAAAALLYYVRHFFFWHAVVVGLGVAILSWSVARSIDRLRAIYRPPE